MRSLLSHTTTNVGCFAWQGKPNTKFLREALHTIGLACMKCAGQLAASCGRDSNNVRRPVETRVRERGACILSNLEEPRDVGIRYLRELEGLINYHWVYKIKLRQKCRTQSENI